MHLVHPSFVHMDLIHPRKAEGNCGGKGSAATDQVWGYEWVEVVWRLGLTHKNPQVGGAVSCSAPLSIRRRLSHANDSLPSTGLQDDG